MFCATKVYNGLLWHLRKEYEETGKVDISRKNLNRILKELPRAKGYYSMSVQLTRDEVREAYKSFFALRKKGLTQHHAPGFRRKNQLSPPSSTCRAASRSKGTVFGFLWAPAGKTG